MFDKDWWLRKDLWAKADFVKLCLGVLPDTPNIKWTEDLLIQQNQIETAVNEAVLAKVLPCINPTDTQDAAHRLYGGHRFFRPTDAIAWASKHFPNFVFSGERAPMSMAREHQQNQWPWGGHHTKALGHLEAAARRFWVNYDPTDNTTAPTNQDVSTWLQSDRGLSRTMADAMASILRPDGLPPGPRR